MKTNEELFNEFAKKSRIENRSGADDNNFYDIRFGFIKACEIKDKEIQKLQQENEKLKQENSELKYYKEIWREI